MEWHKGWQSTVLGRASKIQFDNKLNAWRSEWEATFTSPCDCMAVGGCVDDACRNRRSYQMCVPGLNCCNSACRNCPAVMDGRNVEVRSSPGLGGEHQGVYATSHILKGTLLMPYAGKYVHGNQVDGTYLLQSHFVSEVGPDWHVEGSGCMGAKLNHLCTPNKGKGVMPNVSSLDLWHTPNSEKHEERWVVTVFVAIRDIEKDEELLWNYGADMKSLEKAFGGACKCANCVD